MDILIVGPTNSGKSKLGDFIRNTIFRIDKKAKITVDDPDRSKEPFGNGSNVYKIEVKQISPSSVSFPRMTPEDLTKDIIIILPTNSLPKWFNEVLES